MTPEEAKQIKERIKSIFAKRGGYGGCGVNCSVSGQLTKLASNDFDFKYNDLPETDQVIDTD